MIKEILRRKKKYRGKRVIERKEIKRKEIKRKEIAEEEVVYIYILERKKRDIYRLRDRLERKKTNSFILKDQ
jgi:hypothetical protein